MRIESDWPATSGMGGYFHRLTSAVAMPAWNRPRRGLTVFDTRLQASVSKWLISQLTLSDAHSDHLASAQRRLDHEQVERRGYRTWPAREERARLASLAVAEFGKQMEGFPGFYRDRDSHPAFAGPEGLLLPVRDADDAVRGFQIRPDDRKFAKRIWLSSAGKRAGAGSGAPAHWSWPRSIEDPFTAYIVEGVLSADICSDILGALCIGLAGKTNWRPMDPERLSEELVENVVIALDQDDPLKRTDDTAQTIAVALREQFRVQLARWNGSRAKGFDDCLNKGLRFSIY